MPEIYIIFSTRLTYARNLYHFLNKIFLCAYFTRTHIVVDIIGDKLYNVVTQLGKGINNMLEHTFLLNLYDATHINIDGEIFEIDSVGRRVLHYTQVELGDHYCSSFDQLIIDMGEIELYRNGKVIYSPEMVA